MDGHISCGGTELENGGMVVENVSLPGGTLSRVYLSCGGISAICAHTEAPQVLYKDIRSALGTAGFTLYIGEAGRYDPFEQLVQSLPDGSEQRDREICERLSCVSSVYTEERILRMYEQLVRADAHHRGYYRDPEGVLFVRRHDHFERASELDPDRQFMLTLFGGFLGLHRFAMGKIFSGLFYLLTCGVFLAGWLLDILQLFIGIQRDRQKALILPLRNRRSKLLCLFPALVAGAVAIIVYLQFFTGLTDLAAGYDVQNGLAEDLANTLLQLFPELSESP